MPPLAAPAPSSARVRFRQLSNQLFVGRRKAKRRQLAPGHPPHLLAEQRPRLSHQPAAVEVEHYRTFGIRVRRLEDQLGDFDIGVELLADLAAQRLRMRFRLVDLAAWK